MEYIKKILLTIGISVSTVAMGQTTGAGTGRWITLDSASTWRTDDGLIASN